MLHHQGLEVSFGVGRTMAQCLLTEPVPQAFFARPAEVVAPELIGCLLLKRQADGELMSGVIVETEAYCQSEPASHGHRRRSPSNETLFGEPGRFYVDVSYGIHHCVNVVTGCLDWANGVQRTQLPLRRGTIWISAASRRSTLLWRGVRGIDSGFGY